MAWVAVDEDKSEWVYGQRPVRDKEFVTWELAIVWSHCVRLPSGTIKKLIGRDLTWEDEPVELI